MSIKAFLSIIDIFNGGSHVPSYKPRTVFTSLHYEVNELLKFCVTRYGFKDKVYFNRCW